MTWTTLFSCFCCVVYSSACYHGAEASYPAKTRIFSAAKKKYVQQSKDKDDHADETAASDVHVVRSWEMLYRATKGGHQTVEPC